MASDASLVSDFAIVLGVAGATGVVSQRLRLPPILGYLLAGLIVGPYLPIPLFADVQRVHDLSELGVVLVMFAVGLEFQLSSVAKVIPTAGLAAVFQIGGLFWLGTALGAAFGLSSAGQVVLGASLCISSTMAVSSIFNLHAPPKDVRGMTLGVLVLQDIVAIVLITVVTVVAQGSGASASELFRFIGVFALELGGLVVVGLFVVPRVSRFVAALNRPEVDAVYAAGLCFSLAAIIEYLGYSPALGAFVAGMLIAEAGLGQRYEHVIAPLRDVFAAIFFVSVGMTVDPGRVLESLPRAALVAGIVAGSQFVLLTAGGLLSGAGLKRSGHVGLALGQLGEFSFIIAGVGTAAGVLDPSWLTVLISASVITTLTTALALSRVETILVWIEHRVPTRLRDALVLHSAWMQKLSAGVPSSPRRLAVRRLWVWLAIDGAATAGIIIGIATAHPAIVGWLQSSLGASAPVATALALAATTALTFPFALGAWRLADALGAAVGDVVFPPPAPDVADVASTSRRTVTLALRLGARLGVGVFILTLARPFVPLGIGVAILAVAIAPSIRRLWRSGDPLNAHVKSATLVLLEALRSDEPTTADSQIAALRHTLGDAVYLRLDAQSPAVGRSLADLDLRAKTGVSVLAIVGGDGDARALQPGTTLQTQDVLAVAGAKDAVMQACEALGASLHEPGS